jgi:hypothetical protein
MEEEKQVALTGERMMIPFGSSIFLDMARFEAAQRVGTLLASSTMVPKQFENNVANCVIALNLAERLHVDPFMMMQSMYVVHGRPGIEAKLAIALIEDTGRFTPLQYRCEGTGKTKKDVERPDSCVAWAKEVKTGEIIEGPKITWAMAEAERWTQDKGTEISKWQTMPDLMFRYRAAMFFARVNCPGALLGLRSTEELEDMQMIDVTPECSGTPQKNGEERAAAIQKFTDSIPEGAPHLDEFLKLTAQSSRYKDVDSLKVAISSDLVDFWLAYRKWEAKNYPKDTKAANEANGKTPQSKQAEQESSKREEAGPRVDKSASSNPTEEKKENSNGSAMDRVRALEKERPKLFKEACKQAEIDYPMSDTGALIVLKKATAIYQTNWDEKKGKPTK